MKKLYTIILYCLLVGCASHNSIVHTRLSYCIPESIFAAQIFKEKAEVRIALYHVDTVRNIDHAQAEAYVDNTWKPLNIHWSFKERRVAVSTGIKDVNIKAYRYVSLQDWIKEQIK